jgi:7,8-dihydro-6-hydroxymethylpterin-pyrophosphokinase
MVTTSLSPDGLLTLAQGIEATLGREVSFPNGPRLIDIDILFYDKQVIKTPRLVIPHPRLEERAFVLIPLAEIAPELVHPINQMTVSQLARRIRGQEKVEKMGKLELV